MLHKAVLIGSELFHKHEARASFYDEYLLTDSFRQLRYPAHADVPSAERLILFVNQWATHYQSSPSQLAEAIRAVAPLLSAFNNANLIERELDSTAQAAIEQVFEAIATCGPRYEPTGTSKIMHMLNPDVFVMWDGAIRGGYAAASDAKHYARSFLARVQTAARQAVKQVAETQRMSPAAAIQHLTPCGHTLAKVMDEYNYAKFTLRRDEVWDAEYE